ncbi:MAG: uroporphyrinogen-III C-methyltransferase [Deltaproteobacteria bacterium]|nr:MAG: uroporphyrinogen-III C-methyltransferase [Deltaproteobacteria bacterium]
MYPVMLDLRGRACLVVGGGGVALRKVKGLLEEGARVTVVAERACEPLRSLCAGPGARLERRAYRPGEAAGYRLVFAATDDREVNRLVAEDAGAAGVWVNVADDPELCAFHLPARVRRGAFQLAVASTGEAPFAVRRIRQLLERRLGEEWAEWMDAAARFRRAVRRAHDERPQREAAYDAFFAATVDEASLRVRVPTEEQQADLLRQVRQGTEVLEGGTEVGSPVAPDTSDSSESTGGSAGETTPAAGSVFLVGAGPGDAGLLTLRGRQRLMEADAVVYDRLAATALPTDLPGRVELHPVGKQAGHHPVPQEEINDLLVRLARRGLRVVRLKGGDPYVFGRGGEEAEALAAAGIEFEVVPGVTAGLAAPAYAGIPVTHRREVVRVTLVTAHEAKKSSGPQVRWDLLAADAHATLLGYMGVTSLPQVTARLLEAGMNPDTPAAVIARATTSAQRSVVATVATVVGEVKRAGIEPPALFVIGPTVRHAGRLDWYSRRPLQGRRLVLVGRAARWGRRLSRLGAEVIPAALPVSEAARVVMGVLPLSGCVFGDPDDVEIMDDERDGPGFGPQTVAFCRDEETARTARRLGWQRVEDLGTILTV